MEKSWNECEHQTTSYKIRIDKLCEIVLGGSKVCGGIHNISIQ
jgi:hypothetical protein